ncbi:MAG: tetraacyldisaccharide 4'-kinase [Methylococcales bacterium]
MKQQLSRKLLDVWYKDPFIGTWLMPLGFVFSDIAKFRKFLYKIGIKKAHRLPVPVIIVGNITVGGTGKTPLVIYLAKLLKDAGYKPGIISRGYGGQADAYPQTVSADSTAEIVGDEALLIAKHSTCPVVVGPIRVAAGRQLLSKFACDVILSDDGLQHYALKRDIEIAVVDGERRFGNGYCLPAGPLREPIDRLQSVDFVVVNGQAAEPNEFSMAITGNSAINLQTGAQKALAAFAGQQCHAVAGIGNPQRFFSLLSAAGLICETKAFPDHHQFQGNDISFKDDKPVLMTEKDAVKCTAICTAQHWYVPVTAQPDPKFTEQLLNLLRETHVR